MTLNPEIPGLSECRRDPDMIFTERLADVYYQVHAWKTDTGLAFALPMYNTFGQLVEALCPGMPHEAHIAVAHAQYGKCLLRAARELGFSSIPEHRFCDREV